DAGPSRCGCATSSGCAQPSPNTPSSPRRSATEARLSAPSSNTCRLLARDHAAPEPTLALSKADQPCCGRVRPLAWCSRPRSSTALLEGALDASQSPVACSVDERGEDQGAVCGAEQWI